MWFKSECNTISDRLWDYSAQRLSVSETAQVEGHLQRCSKCQAEANAYRQTVSLLGSARTMPVPASQKTWQDLRPRLEPARRPSLRSADLLPRLTLAGAGAALAATLLVVFLSSGHHSFSPGNSTPGSNDRSVVASSGPVTPLTTPDTQQTNSTNTVAQNDTPPEVEASKPSLSMGSFFTGLLSAPNSGAKPTQATTPKFAVARPKNTLRYARLAANGRNRSHSSATSRDADAQLDGGNVTPRAQQNYVLNPVSSSDEETTHRYVISSIPMSQSGKGMIASSDEAEEGRAW